MSIVANHNLQRLSALAALLLASSGLLLGSSAQAGVVWTTGNGGDGLWSNTANWGGTLPLVNDTLTFGATTGATTLTHDLPNTYLWSQGASVINATNFRTTGITFSADAPAYVINGQGNGSTTFTVDGTITVNSAGNITQTINSNLSGTGGTTVAGTGNLTLGGSYSRLGTYNPPVTMNGAGVLTLNGGGSFTPTGNFNVNSGTVVLSKSAGQFKPGGVILNGGTVKLAAAEQLKSSGNLTLNGGTLDLNGYDSNVNGNGTGVAIGSSGSTGGIALLAGLGGRITNNAAGTGTNWLVINQGGGQQGSYGGTISDGDTAKVGLSVMANYNQSAFQALSGNNTYSGGTFIQHLYTGSGGRPEILSIANVASIGSAGNRTLTFKGGASSADVVLQLTGTAVTNSNQFDAMTFTSGLGAGIDVADPNNTFTLGKNAAGTDISFTGAGVLEKLGAGTLVITSGSLSNTGGTYLGGGTLKIDAQNGGSLASSSAPVFAGGSLYLLGKNALTTTQTLGNVSLTQLNNYASSGGAGMITVDANGGAGTTLALGTLPNSTSAGYTLNIKVLTGGQVSTTMTTTTNGLVGNGRIVFTDASNAVDFASIPASGTRYIQAAAYTPGLPASGSTSTVNYSQQNNASVTTSESVNALKLTTSTTGQSLAITSGQTLTLATGGLLFTGANDYSITGGTLASNTATNSDLIVHQYGAGALTIGSVIANGAGASTLTKAGTGTLVLSGTNTYTGQTYVTGGTLSISSDSNLGGANGTFSGLTSLTTSASVTSSAASLPAGFVVGSTMLGRTVNAIGGTSGAYTITLSGNANTALSGGTASWAFTTALGLYSGGVLQATGNITLQESNTGGTAGTTTVNRNVTIGNSGGGFDVAGGNTLTISGNINAAGMMTKSGAGTLALAAANNLLGGLTINDGTVKQNVANSLTNNNSSTATSNLIFGSGAAPKFQLNNFDAAVTSLVSSNTAAIVENGVAGTRTLTVSNGADNTYAGKLQNGSAGTLALVKSGGGTLTLSGSNTFTGTTRIDNGVFSIPTILANGSAQPLGQGTGAILLGSSAAGTLQYTGATAANLGRDITVNGAGGGIVRNTGGSQLTLSGTLAKDGRVLTLTGSAGSSILVTGKITGPSAGSDLNVDGISTTLSNANNDYNGPTSVYNGGTLYSGASNVLPNATDVLLGNASTGGVWDLSGYTDTISSLSFGVGGGTVRFTLGTNPSPRVSATTATLANGNVAFNDMPDGSVGKYTLITGTVVGSNIGGSSPSSDYRIIVSGSEVDLQHKAVQTMTSPTPATVDILLGGWLPVGATLSNTAPVGSADLVVDLADGGSTHGALGSFTASSTLGANGSMSVGAVFTATSYGTGVWSLQNSDPHATTPTTAVGGTVNVGWATADNSDNTASFGPALTGHTSGAYDGLASTVKYTSGTGGYVIAGTLGHTATILTGDATGDPVVSMEWRTQTQAERTSGMLVSDVVHLTGITTGDKFTLQMDYDPALLPGGSLNESSLAAAKGIYLAYLAAGDHWMNAVFGDGITDPASTFQGFNAPDETLGHWGVNTTDHTVWAVLDYNGTFAVVPEPGTLALLACGLVALVLWRRRGV